MSSVNVTVELTDIYCRRAEGGCGAISWYDSRSLEKRYRYDDDPKGGSSSYFIGYYAKCGKLAGGVMEVPTIAKTVTISTSSIEVSEP
jgi:hypothetical protein